MGVKIVAKKIKKKKVSPKIKLHYKHKKKHNCRVTLDCCGVTSNIGKITFSKSVPDWDGHLSG